MAAEDGPDRSKALGAFIKSQRRLAALSLRQLADMTSVSNAYLSQIERGMHQPSLRVLRAVAGALDLPPSLLLEHAGMDRADPSPSSDAVEAVATAAAIQRDPDLSEADKQLLLAMYQRMRGFPGS